MMSQQLYVCLFVVKKSLKNHIRPIKTIIENEDIRRYHVLENKLTLTKKSQSLNRGRTQNLYQVALEFLSPSLIRFLLTNESTEYLVDN